MTVYIIDPRAFIKLFTVHFLGGPIDPFSYWLRNLSQRLARIELFSLHRSYARIRSSIYKFPLFPLVFFARTKCAVSLSCGLFSPPPSYQFLFIPWVSFSPFFSFYPRSIRPFECYSGTRLRQLGYQCGPAWGKYYPPDLRFTSALSSGST